MFRLHKSSSKTAAKSGERIDFKFSQFKALQVPKGWDKLFVSIIAVETGKTVAKSSKAVVRNGTCQWSETLSESIWISQEESSMELEDCLFKLVLSMGSARSGILGETTLNMTGYMSSSAVVPVSIPLKKCNHGTILQVKIHCLTPRQKREDESEGQNSHNEDHTAKSKDMDIRSDESDIILASSVGSSSGNELVSASVKEEPESRGTSFPASGSRNSYDSAEGSEDGVKFSSQKNLSSENGDNLIGKPESTSSRNNVPRERHHVVKASGSYHSSNNVENTGSGSSSVNNQQQLAAATYGFSASSRSLLEVAEPTTEELRAESKMWERNSQKLILDMDIPRKEFTDLSRKQANLETELLAVCAERDGLRDEVEQLKLLLEKSMVKPTTLEESTFQDKGVTLIQKQLEDEIKLHKESNANLALQLKRSQESNIELLTALQELEETFEKQKLEIENLSLLQSKFSQMENSIQANIEENKNLVFQLQQLQESEEDLQAKVQLLEQALEEKDHSIEEQLSMNKQILLEAQTEYKVKLSAKHDEIESLKAKLSESHNEKYSVEIEYADLRREIEDLKVKLEELERDCTELTEENLDLLFKLKEIKSNSTGERASSLLPSSDLSENSSSRSEVSDPESEVHNLEEKLKKKVSREIENHYDVQVQQLEIIKNELEVKVTGLTEELSQKVYEIETLEAKMLSKEEETKYLQHCQSELQANVASLQEEKILLQGNTKIVSSQRDIDTKLLNDLQNGILVLRSSTDSHVSTNITLERKSSELESEKRELELHLSEVQHENSHLSDCVSGLDAQLRSVMEERESREQELENSNSLVMNLQDEVARLRSQMETQKTDLIQKLEEMHNQWLEAEEECEYLRREHPHLQDTAKSLVEERSSIEQSNEDLRKQKFELQDQCTNLEAKLRESHESLANCSKKVSGLEENLSSLVENIALKERSLTSQLDALVDENGKQMEKLVLAESLLKRKTLEIDNLRRQIGNLSEQLSATKNEREQIASEAEHEVSGLLADKAKLECTLEELQSKVHSLMDELATSKEDQEILMSNHEKVLKLLETCQSSEERCKINLNDLELKLTVCEYERQKLMEEFTGVKVQLLRMEQLEDKIFSLKNELDATKSEKDKLKTSLKIISGECEDLKVQKLSFLEKISTLQMTVSELEDCKHSKALSEEKLLQMEGDLSAKQALCAQNIELKNELSLIKRDNSQFQWKIQLLEEEKGKSLLRVQALEEELNLIKEERQNQKDSSSKNSNSGQHQIEGNNGHERHHRSSAAARVDSVLKIQSLETEVARLREANKKYKVQLDRLQSEGRNINAKARKSKGEAEVVTKERFERTKSSLETELKDIRERYLQMSLKYAEVEAQREELVMKLKIAKNGKRWFS